ncbi:lipid A biosynthesis lauroyl acyltransferase [Vibrio sp. 10N.286.49.B3]|uniref:LpxL/LpxP family Kdo(2)-lipid IV(A) lauroyl/palmitoleoyl acyltransferase n=1 Tax=Vibrio sp. 10N.286.49.B3 TaxID=1880855 RepID=UPI000C8589C6|nr:LpxL/LpxP family Kdo(2)-lipid IV(A) lauroyl/palmitoleoyl acyltransferase [Vibrio sp. 10N.286.49.B3]PMH45995.1 lipid A biosynthesis lauroyl acyltransferase [Vibrio sp. 10N.286.49.B3]
MKDSLDRYPAPKFTLSLLHPRNWGVWAGFGLLALLVNLLPYALLLKLGHAMGQLGMRYGKKRVHVAKRNIELAFPDKSADEVDALVAENFKNTGLALIETGITWFWPTWRFKRLIDIKDISGLAESDAEGKGVLLACVHALNLEITARAYAVVGFPGYGAYRPHNNPAYDYIQYNGRTQNGNRLIDRKDLKQMIRVLRNGGRLFYLADHDYGMNKSVFVPFFAVKDACTTTGSSILAYTSKCAIVPGSGFRNDNNQYDLIANKRIEADYPQDDSTAAAAYLNHYLEEVILRAPEQWMWLHKRYKTMPDGKNKGIRYK